MTEDPWRWLEDVEGEKALDWVREKNRSTEADLFSDPMFEGFRTAILGVLEADDRIPMPSRQGESTVVNFWTDRDHRRGLLRRTTWDRYRERNEDWEILLDVDALAETEGESWVFRGTSTRHSDWRRMLIDLSPGGSDATVTREFDLVEKRFIPPEEGGFYRPLAKGGLAWVDDDTVYVRSDFGEGSLTTSGYPRTVRRWARGTSLDDAPTVFEGEVSDVSVGSHVSTFPGYPHHLFYRGLDFYNARHYLLRDGTFVEIDVPTDVDVGLHGPWLTLHPRLECSLNGTSYPGGSLLVADLEAFLAGDRTVRVVFEPTESAALGGYSWTRDYLILRVHEHVRDRLEVVDPSDDWRVRAFAAETNVWTVSAGAVDSDASNEVLLSGNDFLTPPSLFEAALPEGEPELLRTSPARFDTAGLAIEQRFATSADGTRVPYFVVGPTEATGARPTLLNAYGGFEVANVAGYSGMIGRSWLERGGTYVLANIRGGGEYGPRWHRAGLRENRHRVYEDFEAVARALIDDGVTSPAQLGIMGGSNGGLLVGNMYVRTPQLFGAVVCQVPLLDMQRYHLLLAGASWMAEYGDPDNPDDWAFMQTFSPYHLVEAGRSYPPILLTTSTRDDRVHPGHARKMAARLTELGHRVTYWENIEGGHGGAADAAQQATMWALAYTFLHRCLAGG